MDCHHAGLAMDVALDGAVPADLEAHLARCPECAADWARLKTLDARLRCVSLMDPPMGFQSAVMARIATAEAAGSRPLVVRALLDTAMILAGVGLTVSVLSGVFSGVSEAFVVEQARVLLHGLEILISTAPVGHGVAPMWWPLNLALAALVAAAWFGALVIPRRSGVSHAHQSASTPRDA